MKRKADVFDIYSSVLSIFAGKLRNSLTSATFLICLAFPAAAQQPLVVELDPIVVTASALPHKRQDTSAVVTVITREELERMHANRVSEVLGQTTGLQVDEMGSRGGLSSVYIRGGDPNFSTVMIDGVPINDPTNPRGGSVDLSTLTPEAIERIEIVRGPLSSLYGSDAMAGAINLITRRGESERSYEFGAEGGSFGYARTFLNGGGTVQGIKYALSAAFTRNDEQVKKDRFHGGTFGLNLDLLESPNATIRLTNRFTVNGSRGFPEGSGGPRHSILRDTEERDAWEITSAIHFFLHGDSRWKQEFTATVFHREQDVTSPGVQVTPPIYQIPPARFGTEYGRYQFLWKNLLEITGNWSFAAGAQMTWEEGRRDGLQKLTAIGAPADVRSNFQLTRFTPALMLETNITPLEHLRITTALRSDFPEKGNPELSPKFGLLYRALPETNLRVNIGKGFKLPSFNALGDPLIGNPNVKPEKSLGADIGIEQVFLSDRVSVGLTYFYNRFSRLIDLDPALAQARIFRLVNLSTAETQGAEASLNLRLFEGAAAKAFYTYLHSDIRGTDQPLRNRPRFSGGVSLDSALADRWSMRAVINLVGKKLDLQIPTRRNQTAAYAKADLSLTYQPNPDWQLFGTVENFTNTRYENYIGFPAPGTSVRIGFRLRR